METSEVSNLKAYPTCKICDRGTLMPRKIRRLSGPAVAIGYILLIPSILGMAACAILFIVSLLAAITSAAHESVFATAFVGTWSLAVVSGGIGCFVFGLVGWLLVMKKHVLQCVYCGAVVDAAAAPSPLRPDTSGVSARNIIFVVVFILGITGAIWAFIVAEAGTQTSTLTATTAEQVRPTPDTSVAEPAQPTQVNSAAAPAQPDTMQPFTSADGRFSVLFPGTPQQSSRTIHLENGETTMAYRFASADNGTSYVVTYADYQPDVGGPSPQVFLQGNENFAVNGKRLLTDAAISLDGVPGRAFTFTGSYADGSTRSCNVHEFLAGTRLYTLTVLSPPFPLKGDTATQAGQFMNSFRILEGNPQTATAAGQAQPTANNSLTESAQSQHAQHAKTGWKTYEADNGQQFRVDLSSVLHLNIGWAQVFVYEVGYYAPQNMMFDCRGDYVLNDAGNEENWMPVPSRSVLAQIAEDVCAKPLRP